jgi:inorganic pyrophosphatase
MSDEAGEDAKILAVPVQKLTQYYNKIETYLDFPEADLDKIAHFFEHYKDLEKGKWVKIEGWEGIESAEAEIISSIERYNNMAKKPAF